MKHLLIIFFFFFTFTCSAQQWKKSYAPTYLSDWVIEDYDKGYIILGTNSITYRYGLILKTDINGNVLWSKHFGNGQYLIAPENIELTSDRGLVIGGTISKYGNQQDAFILKLNSCGEVDWCSDIYTPALPYDLGWRVKQTKDNGYLLLGSYNNPDPALRTNLFKFNNVGNLLWQKAYLPDSAVFGDDGMDLTVDSSSYLITLFCYYPNPGGSGGYERYYFIDTDTIGNKIWSAVYGATSFYYGTPFSTIRSLTGNYYSFGYHDVLNSTSSVPSMVKMMGNGIPAYNKDIVPNVGTGGFGASVWDSDTNIIVGGGWLVNNYSCTDALFKIDTLGNIIQSHILDTTANSIYCIAKSIDNKFISVATKVFNNHSVIVAYKVNSNLEWDSIYTHPYIYDSLCVHPIVSDTIDPNCQLVVNVEEPLTSPETHKMKIFPNPADHLLTIIFPKYLLINDNSPPVKSTTVYHQWKSTILEAFDLSGNQVLQKEILKDQPLLELDVSSWPKGMYLFNLLYNNSPVSSEKILIR
jgi:hypothetical protein